MIGLEHYLTVASALVFLGLLSAKPLFADTQEDLAAVTECSGFDGQFENRVDGILDWWVVSEIGCERPGFSWTVVDCATGNVVDTFLGAELDELESTRNAVFEGDSPSTFGAIIVKLGEKGLEPVRRANPLSKNYLDRNCQKAGVSQ